jgi:hypothetical protein
MKRIVKVIYSDGLLLELENIQPLGILDTDDNSEIRLKRAKYNRQFKDFEEDILDNMQDDWVQSYAESKFNLIDEDEVEEKKIDDFSDKELIQEINYRNIDLPSMLKVNIITEDFVSRFLKIMEKENQILLDSVLTEFENKLNI